MPVPPHIDAAYRKSLTDTLAYYTSLPGDQRGQIAAIETALSLEIGNPASREGAELASLYRETGIQKPPRSRNSMSQSERAKFNAIKRFEQDPIVHRRQILQLKAALNTPIRGSTNAESLNRRRNQLRKTQKSSNKNRPNARPPRNTYVPTVSSPLAGKNPRNK